MAPDRDDGCPSASRQARLLRSFAQARVVEEKEKSQGDMKQSFVPGMAMYHSHGEDVEMKSDAEFSQSLDRAEESINSNEYFLPASR